MPSVKRSYQWFVRVDYPRDEVSRKVKQVAEWIDLKTALAVFHVGQSGENPHFHMILTLTTELQKQSVDVRFKNLFNVKGSQFSSKVWDGKAGAGSYLFHEETDDIIFNKGYSKEHIDEFKRLNQEVKKVIEINKERGTNKMTQKLIEKLEPNSTREVIFYAILDAIRNGDMYHPGFRMSALVDEIYIKLTEDKKWSDVKWYSWLEIQKKNNWT